MSEGEYHAYVGLLAFSGLMLSVLAVRGFGQRAGSRVVEGVAAAGFLGYAVYLVATDPPTVRVFYYAFAAPVVLLVHMFRSRGRARRRRFAAGLTQTQQQAYAAPAAQTPLTPFPPPPPPLGNAPAHEDRPDHQQHRSTYQPLPSGLPGAPAPPPAPVPLPPLAPGLVMPPAPPPPVPGGPRRAMPSGLPGRPDGPQPAWSAPPTPSAPSGPSAPSAPPAGLTPAEPRWAGAPEQPWHAEPRTPVAGPDAQAGHDTHGGYQPAHETSTRLRRPAYLSPDPPRSPGPGSGRHRAGDADEDDGPPHGDWPPRHG
jgi:hypothetical protein